MVKSPASDPPPPNLEEKEYNARMRQWMAKQSFWYRLSHARRHPEAPSLFSVFFRVGWKVVALVAVGGLLYYGGLMRHLDGGAFQRYAVQEFSVASKAHSGRARSVQWSGGILTLAGLTMTGAPEGFYLSYTADSVRVPLEMRDLFQPEGKRIGEVTFQGLDIELRGGSLSEAEQARVSEQMRDRALPAGHVRASGERRSGWPGLSLDGLDHSVDRVIGRNANIRWGVGMPSEGELLNARFEWERQPEGWRCLIESGTLQQGWLRGWRADNVVLVERDGVVTFEKGNFISRSGAKGELTGTFTLGGAPRIDLRMKIREAPAGDVVRAPFRDVLAGFLDMDFTIQGVLNDPEGLRFEGRGEVVRNMAFRPDLQGPLALLAVLASRGGAWPLQAIDASEGEFTFESDKDGVVVRDLRLFGSANIRVGGGWEYDSDAGEFSGKVDLRVEERIFGRDDPVRSSLFSQDGEGMLRLEVPLEGYFDDLTVPQAEVAAELRRQAMVGSEGL